MAFHQERTLAVIERFRNERDGTFIAAPGDDYHACWLRDTLYAAYAYKYFGQWDKLLQAVWTVNDLFLARKQKILRRIASPVYMANAVLHAKYGHDANGALVEITQDEGTHGWGHHQLDVIGLYLYLIADLDYYHRRPLRDERDHELLQLLIGYLRSVEYWCRPDFGMWEEDFLLHSSSVGAVVGGLSYLKRQRIPAELPDPLIQYGLDALGNMLPHESRETCGNCLRERHVEEESHDCDAAQLSLIWPYHIVVNPEKIRIILSRVLEGHQTAGGKYHRLVQPHGLHRYWGDNFERSSNGFSAEWPMFFFWASIVSSQLNQPEQAFQWFKRGMGEMIDDGLPELYRNGKPNAHTPLVWGTALSLIAYQKLPQEYQQEVSKD